MAEDATSDAQDNSTAEDSATEDEATQAQQMLADAIGDDDAENDDEDKASKAGPKSKTASGKDDKRQAGDRLGDAGKRALVEERNARREAEKQLKALNDRLAKFEDRDKTELQKAIERAEAAEKGASSMRVQNARLMAAAMHDLPVDLIELLGDGSDEEIDKRAQLLAEKLTAAAPAEQDKPAPKAKPRRPVESLTPGARPAGDRPTNPNDLLRAMAAQRRG